MRTARLVPCFFRLFSDEASFLHMSGLMVLREPFTVRLRIVFTFPDKVPQASIYVRDNILGHGWFRNL